MENYAKILKTSKRPLIIIFMMFVISFVLFGYGAELDEKALSRTTAKDYNELIFNNQDVEEEYVEVTITDIPYGFAEGDDSKKYYFVFDEYDYMYIVRLTDTTYSMLENMYNENSEEFSYTLKGFIFNDSQELKEIAISSYNESMEEVVVNNDNFSAYFGDTYLDEELTPYSDTSSMLYSIGIIIDMISFVLLILYIIRIILNKSTLKKYDKEDLEYELSKPSTIEYKKANIYLTDKYIISKVYGLTVVEYNELVWLYNLKRKYNGIPVGIYLMALDSKKIYQIAKINTSIKNEELLIEIMNKIKDKNPSIMLGYTEENRQKYKEIKNNK